MIVYSIFVSGSCDCVSNRFTAHSKEIYTSKPTQEQINNFVNRCCTGGFINLNKEEEYKVQIIEHPLIEN